MHGTDWHKDEYPADVQQAMERLLTTPVASGLKSIHLLEIAVIFEHVTHQATLSWDRMTEREHQLWLDRFRSLSAEFLRHLRAGPRPPKDWHIPPHPTLLSDLDARYGLSSHREPPPAADDTVAVDVDESKGLSLENILTLYAYDVRHRSRAGQLLKKPGDPQSSRARFIVMLRLGTNLSVGQIAAVASTLFQDEAIDERLVRRLGTGTFSEN